MDFSTNPFWHMPTLSWIPHVAQNDLKFQVFQNKSLRVTGDYPRDPLIPKFNGALKIEPIQDILRRFTATFLANSPSHTNPLFQHFRHYTLDDGDF